MQIVNRAELAAEEIEAIERELAGQENLRDVLNWALMSPADFLPQIVADVIVQDEFTHDVVVPWRKLFLVFETT